MAQAFRRPGAGQQRAVIGGLEERIQAAQLGGVDARLLGMPQFGVHGDADGVTVEKIGMTVDTFPDLFIGGLVPSYKILSNTLREKLEGLRIRIEAQRRFVSVDSLVETA